METRMQCSPKLHGEYVYFMREYINLGQMRENRTPGQANQQEVFLPHHGVIGADGETTGLRMVLDGSARGAKGSFLNNALFVRPGRTGQSFCDHCSVRDSPVCLHRGFGKDVSTNGNDGIVDSPSKSILEMDFGITFGVFALQTITYGTSFASYLASYLATRTLAQLARDNGINFPLADGAISKDFYVDDVLTGADALTGALELRNQLIQLCDGGKLKIRKRCSNHPSLLTNLSPEDLGEIHGFTRQRKDRLRNDTFWKKWTF